MYRAGANGDSSRGAVVLPSRHTAHVHAPALSSWSSEKGGRCKAAAPPACACTDGGGGGASSSSASACSCAQAYSKRWQSSTSSHEQHVGFYPVLTQCSHEHRA